MDRQHPTSDGPLVVPQYYMYDDFQDDFQSFFERLFSSCCMSNLICGIKRCYPALFSTKPRRMIIYETIPNSCEPPKRKCYRTSDCLGVTWCCFLKFVSVSLYAMTLGAALYYMYNWYYLKTIYNEVVEEVREAQNERKLLEEELNLIQNSDSGCYITTDEIGDTKRQIMLGEIERITQYLQEAKEEINELMDQKESLKDQLKIAKLERDTAKCEYDSVARRHRKSTL